MDHGLLLLLLLGVTLSLAGQAVFFVVTHRRLVRLERNSRTAFRQVLEAQKRQAKQLAHAQRVAAEDTVQAGYVNALASLFPKFPVFMGGPAIDGYSARALFERIENDRPKVVVEFGSGSSTVMIAALLDRLGMHDTRHIAIDDNEYYLGITERNVSRHGFNVKTEFWHCPLKAEKEGEPAWYSGVTERLAETKVDLVLVDGPVGELHPMSRYPAMDVMLPLMSDSGVLILDDAQRPGEDEIVSLWQEKFPDLAVRRKRRGKGYAEFSRVRRG